LVSVELWELSLNVSDVHSVSLICYQLCCFHWFSVLRAVDSFPTFVFSVFILLSCDRRRGCTNNTLTTYLHMFSSVISWERNLYSGQLLSCWIICFCTFCINMSVESWDLVESSWKTCSWVDIENSMC